MKRITWQVGEGNPHDIPEDAVVTFKDDNHPLVVRITTLERRDVTMVERGPALRQLCINEMMLNPFKESER